MASELRKYPMMELAPILPERTPDSPEDASTMGEEKGYISM
jgi:hypothetical protein